MIPRRLFNFLYVKKIGIVPGTLFLIFLSALTYAFIEKEAEKPMPDKPQIVIVKIEPPKEEEDEEEKPEFPFYYAPVAIDMETIKSQGCVADGLLSGYGKDTNDAVSMINRSKCRYLHRALETWADTPDLEKASEIMKKIKRTDVVYGMFIAEAIRTNGDFPGEEDEDGNFKFKRMCREGTENVWGEHTCRPELSSKEYRDYLRYITQKAMDLGIQSFLFGQVYWQDYEGPNKDRMAKVIKEMRAYAKKKDMQIIIGAQTGAITNEKYLRMFDYIEGGVGMGEDGWVENGPCWSHMESCWALLWNDRYATRANNVLLHFDWSGLKFDDMSVFARMQKSRREEVLNRLYKFFLDKNMGFMMPMMATLNKDNGGCYGPKKGFYSASRSYSCNDEGVINKILGQNASKEKALSQNTSSP